MEPLLWLGRALSDPTRVRILDALRNGELCVCELTDALEMGQSSLSSHLQIARQAGLVATRRQGRWIYYGLEPAAAPLLETVLTAYALALNTDPRLQRDRARIHQRLALRVSGCCVVGVALLPTHSPVKGGETTMEPDTQATCGCDDGCCGPDCCTSGDCTCPCC